MLSLAGLQSQLLGPAVYLTASCSGVISVSHGAVLRGAKPHSRRFQSRPRAASSLTKEASCPTNISDKIQQTLEELGLCAVAQGMDLYALCPSVLAPARQSTHGVTLSSPGYVSAPSFFENKNGFSEKDWICADWPSDLSLPSTTAVSTLLKSTTMAPCFHIQRRGFKTKRVTSGAIGRIQPIKVPADKGYSVLKDLRQSVLGRLSGRKDARLHSDKMANILKEAERNPDLQGKLKLAFAEGYMASSKKAPFSKRTRSMLLVTRIILWTIILYYLLPLLGQLYVSIATEISRMKMMKDKHGHAVNPDEIGVSFADVIGMDEAKQELQDQVDFLKNPDKFHALGARLPKGVLLVGPPGVGKTLLARAVAGEADVPFFQASGSQFDEIYVGQGAKRLRALFEDAKRQAPCIIFIDEIDSVGAKRTSSEHHPYANQTINQLLSEMDGFEQNEGVIVIGATNRRDNLDKALLRPGRFDSEVRVYPPDLQGRRDMFAHYLKNVKTADDIDTSLLARATTGLTGAELYNMVNQAAIRATLEATEAVTMEHMEWARDKILMGPAKKTKIGDEMLNKITACHEAGHALVAFYTKDATPLNKITILPRGMTLGHTSFVPDKEQHNYTRSQLLAEMDVAMGGRVAEEMLLGADKVTTGASSDFKKATNIATAMVKQLGMSDKFGLRVLNENELDGGTSFLQLSDLGPASAEMVDNEIKRLLQESYDRAKAVLKSHQSEHKLLMEALLQHETVNLEELKLVLAGKKLKSKATTMSISPIKLSS